VPGVREPYDWSFDVTKTVQKVEPEVKKAYLCGWYRMEGYSYAGKVQPARTPIDIVNGWKKGYEIALLRIGDDWYWVKVPCKLYPPLEPVRTKENPVIAIVGKLSNLSMEQKLGLLL